MTKKKFLPSYGTLLILFITLILSACHKSSNPGLAYVPKDANLVMSFNIKQLHEKLKDGNFNVDSLMNEIKTQDSAFALLPYLNLKDPILTYVRYKSSITMGNDILLGSIGQLDDKAGFEKELANLYPDKKIEKKDNYSQLTASDEDVLVWNDKTIAFYHTKNAVEQAGNLFNLKSDGSLSKDKNAIKILSNQGDVTIFTNSQDDFSSIPMLSMTKISDLIKGNYGGATINFEKGEIKVNGEFFYNKTVEELMKKNPSGKMNKDILAHFPGKPIALFQMAFSMKQIFSFLDYAGVTSMIETYMKNIGITLDDIANAFTGEVAVAMQSVTGGSIGGDAPKLVVVIPIGDKASFDKVMGAFAKMGAVEQQNGQWVPRRASSEDAWAFHTDDKAITFSTDKTLSETFISGKESIDYPDNLDFSGNTFVLYTDLDKVIGEVSKEKPTTDSKVALETFKDIDMAASQLHGNKSSFNMTLRLKDKSSNSLPVMVSFFQSVNENSKKAKTTISPMTIDSVNAAVPTIPMDTEGAVN